MLTVVLPAGAGVGPVDGEDGVLYPPQPARQATSMRTDVKRMDMDLTLLHVNEGKAAAGRRWRFSE
jgi:hypothetical protein